MELEKLKKDLDSLVKKLENVHYTTENGLNEEQKKLIESTYEKLYDGMDEERFIYLINQILVSFNDAHTMLNVCYSKNDKMLDVDFEWFKDGLYILNDSNGLEKGDKVICINNRTEQQILEELKKIISHENEHWVKARGVEHLRISIYLEWLKLIKDDKVNIKVQRKGQVFECNLNLIEYKIKENIGNWIEYAINKESDLAILKLNECNYNDQYCEKLKKFFEEVSTQGIKNIAVDIRKNMGGNSWVIDEFITYMKNVDEYKTFTGGRRISEESKENFGYTSDLGYEYSKEESIIKNDKKKEEHLLFNGNVYIITSKITFSSGMMFAVLFKDNRLGTIVGEPIGNNPVHYGCPVSLKMLNKIQVGISHIKLVRPDKTKINENTLYPDIEVNTTIEDILVGRDPQVDKIKEIIHNKKFA